MQPVGGRSARHIFPRVKKFRLVARVVKRRGRRVPIPQRSLRVGDVKALERDGENLAGDVVRARRIFEALDAGIKNAKGKLQIIVTEHADKVTWGELDSMYEVANWRDKLFLIPNEWSD